MPRSVRLCQTVVVRQSQQQRVVGLSAAVSHDGRPRVLLSSHAAADSVRHHVLLLLCCRNIDLVRHHTPAEPGPVSSSSSSSGRVCDKLQLQLLTVARVHEAMAEGLAGEGGLGHTHAGACVSCSCMSYFLCSTTLTVMLTAYLSGTLNVSQLVGCHHLVRPCMWGALCLSTNTKSGWLCMSFIGGVQCRRQPRVVVMWQMPAKHCMH